MKLPWLMLLCIALRGQGGAPDPGWLRLFDGETLYGWAAEGEVRARVVQGTLVLEPSAGGWLRTTLPFADFDLAAEFQAKADMDSGLILRSPRGESPGGYQVQIGELAQDGAGTGSFAGMGRSRRARATGDWQRLEVSVRGSTVTVRVDGRETATARSFQAAAGYIGIESPAGGAIRFRSIQLLPAGLAPLFNGRDLSGWRSVDPPKPGGQRAEWTVRDAQIHVEKGPGQLETETAWDDFVLQTQIRVNTVDSAFHPNSGIFFRGDQEAWWSGYESQIRNEFAAGNPAQAVDFGTGGLHGRQAARRVNAADNQWFTKTIVASGRRIGVWVNGLLVTDYEDNGEEGNDVQGGQARLLRGTIALQAHDVRTNVDFRNIQIVPLPRVN